MTYASLSKLGTVLGDPTVDADAVWLEGTSHLIAALSLRRLSAQNDIPSFHGDVYLAASLLENVQVAQNSLGAGQTVNGQALKVGQGLTAAHEYPEYRIRFQLFPVLPYRSDVLVCDGGARGESAANSEPIGLTDSLPMAQVGCRSARSLKFLKGGQAHNFVFCIECILFPTCSKTHLA